MPVLTIITGQSESQKGTAIEPFPSLQGDGPDSWNDTVLDRLDDFMDNANQYGIKLQIAIHSYNALSAGNDFYGQLYGTGDFYTDSEAINNFKDRIAHVLEHVNPHNGKPWSQSSEYIFAFEAQNEAMHDQVRLSSFYIGTQHVIGEKINKFNFQENPEALTSWQCTMAQAIKDGLNGSGDILVTTGGGAYLDNSLLDPYFSCEALDVLAIHAYGSGDFATDKLSPYVQQAQNSSKMLIMQEWGACYYDTSNDRCDSSSPASDRDNNIKTWADSISAAGIPWFYWQILPNEDPHEDWDYEVGIEGANWETLRDVASGTASYDSAFDFSKYLL